MNFQTPISFWGVAGNLHPTLKHQQQKNLSTGDIWKFHGEKFNTKFVMALRVGLGHRLGNKSTANDGESHIADVNKCLKNEEQARGSAAQIPGFITGVTCLNFD